MDLKKILAGVLVLAAIVYVLSSNEPAQPPASNITLSNPVLQKTILYDDIPLHDYEANLENIKDWELYPDLPCAKGEQADFPNPWGKKALKLRSMELQKCETPFGKVDANWNAVTVISHDKELILGQHIVKLEAYFYIPKESFEKGAGVDINPEIFLDAEHGNNNQFAQAVLLAKEGGSALFYVGENDNYYQFADDCNSGCAMRASKNDKYYKSSRPLVTPDAWHRLGLIADFKNRQYLQISLDNTTFGPGYLNQKFTVREDHGTGKLQPFIGFWVSSKLNELPSDIYVGRYDITIY